MKIKVISLNIWRGELLDNTIEFFRRENADILTLQEVYDGKDKTLPSDYRAYEYLQEQFPEYYAAYGAQFCDATSKGNIEEGNAIFSKFPILSSKTTFFDIPYSTFDNHAKTRFDDNPQAVLHAEIKLPDKKANIYCVHGVWGFDGRDNSRRDKMVDVLLDLTENKEDIIMSGDFNMNPDTRAISLLGRKVKSVFGDSLLSTFNMRHKEDGGYKTAAVDMMFVSPNIKVLEKSCPNVDVSDHLPLTVMLEL